MFESPSKEVILQPEPQNAHLKPEIMSPAGYWPQLQAAIEAGADAVYFGLNHFTARAKVGFSLAELPDVVQTLHQRGVKGYVTFNTLVFEHEVTEAAQAIAAIAETGVDSLIVQDIGIAQLARQIAPDLAIHGSTQMSITSAEGIALAQQFGVSRVVLARELALSDIRAIRAETDCELEMFVHGALCVSYSGQCFSSEAWGGRSANRGQCAQACRLPYELLVDEQLKPLGDARYLLSPGDLFALHQIPEIVDLGISALKIEGRYKDANYVALTTQAYRQAVDDAWAGLLPTLEPTAQAHLEQVYSRGLGPHFVSGTNHQSVVQGRSPRHRGMLMGQVKRIEGEQIIIQPNKNHDIAPLKAGDGLVFDAADWRSPEIAEEGGRIYQVTSRKNQELALAFGNGQLDFGRIRPDDWVWRSHNPDTDRAAKPFLQATIPVQKQAVDVNVVAHAGQPLVIHWRLVKHPKMETTVKSAEPLVAAQNQPPTPASIQKQLGRLGNTAYTLNHLDVDLGGNPFIPSSWLNQLRRQAVEELMAQQAQPKVVRVNDSQAVVQAATTSPQVVQEKAIIEHPQIHLLIRQPAQLEAALALKPASITLDYLDFFGLRPAVEQVNEANIPVRVASPRILKPSEQRIIRFLLRLNCEILVRSGGLLQALQAYEHSPLIGDFSLNAANTLSAQTLLKLGLTRLTPTYDLNAAQVTALAKSVEPQKIEVVAYHHLPVFYTEHCVFCRFLSNGTSKENCGQPCERHQIALRDERGRAHPVMADVGCRNTVFGAEAQECSPYLDDWLQAGIGHYRLEFTHETASDIMQITQAFQQTFDEGLPSSQLAAQLQQIAPQGTTEGSLFVPDDYLALPLL